MTATPAGLEVVLDLNATTPMSGTFDDLPGGALGVLTLDIAGRTGLAVTSSDAHFWERLATEVHGVAQAFRAAERRAQEERAWAERRPDGRPLLRAVGATAHPSLSGAVR